MSSAAGAGFPRTPAPAASAADEAAAAEEQPTTHSGGWGSRLQTSKRKACSIREAMGATVSDNGDKKAGNSIMVERGQK